MKQMEGRVALVTGGGQGVGQGIARALGEAGATVVIAQRNAEQGETEVAYIRNTYGVEAAYIQTDVTQRDQVEAMIAGTVERFGTLHALVNNAGASFVKRFEQHSDEDMQAALQLNFWSTFWAMRAAFPIMKAQKYGRIVNMASLNGINAHMFTVGYNASKEAVRAMSNTAAVEWGRHNITVNVICPAAMSPLAAKHFDANPEMRDDIMSQIPVGHFGDAYRDVGPIGLFLCAEASGYLTGCTLHADGGGHINGVQWRPEVED